MTPPPTEEECIRAAGAVLAAGDLAMAQMTPREQAEAAWTPSEPFSVEEKEDCIRVARGLDPIHHDADGMAELEARRVAWRRGESPRRPRGGGASAKPVEHDGD